MNLDALHRQKIKQSCCDYENYKQQGDLIALLKAKVSDSRDIGSKRSIDINETNTRNSRTGESLWYFPTTEVPFFNWLWLWGRTTRKRSVEKVKKYLHVKICRGTWKLGEKTQSYME